MKKSLKIISNNMVQWAAVLQWPIELLKIEAMNKETYNRAVAISNRLSKLQEVKKELEDTHNHYLTYARKANSFGERDSLCTDWRMKYINVILDKHDKIIRQEIDDEIAALNKEIEGL